MEEGRLRQSWYYEGQLHDEVLMSVSPTFCAELNDAEFAYRCFDQNGSSCTGRFETRIARTPEMFHLYSCVVQILALFLSHCQLQQLAAQVQRPSDDSLHRLRTSTLPFAFTRVLCQHAKEFVSSKAEMHIF